MSTAVEVLVSKFKSWNLYICKDTSSLNSNKEKKKERKKKINRSPLKEIFHPTPKIVTDPIGQGQQSRKCKISPATMIPSWLNKQWPNRTS